MITKLWILMFAVSVYLLFLTAIEISAATLKLAFPQVATLHLTEPTVELK